METTDFSEMMLTFTVTAYKSVSRASINRAPYVETILNPWPCLGLGAAGLRITTVYSQL
jgi:hypothetical protein